MTKQELTLIESIKDRIAVGDIESAYVDLCKMVQSAKEPKVVETKDEEDESVEV